MIKNCLFCNEPFETDRNRTKYCKKICYLRDRKENPERFIRNMHTRNCDFCGKLFKPVGNSLTNKHVYCNRKCFGLSNRKPENWIKVKETCARCGKEFEKLKKQIKYHKKMTFCTLKCINKYKEETKLKKEKKKKIIVTLQCHYCKKEFNRDITLSGYPERAFCSNACTNRNKHGIPLEEAGKKKKKDIKNGLL